MKQFVTCHCHPQSLDSGSTPEAFLEREIELGTGAITCTDHGTLVACRKIYDLTRDKKACKGNKVTPILGLEGYLRDDSCPILTANGYQKNATGAFVNAPKYLHFCVHFLDQAAYECGVRLLSKADERLEAVLATLEAKDRKHGQERKPLFTWADMEELGSHNVTMTTGCMIGVVQRHMFDNGDVKTAEAYFQRMATIVKPGNLIVELNPHDTSKDWTKGIFLTLGTGEKIDFYKDKLLMTDVGEVTAQQLAKEWSHRPHTILKSVKDRSTWREMPEVPLLNVEDVEGFLPNECKPWAPDGDYQKGLNRVMRMWAKKYNVPILVGDDSHYAHRDEKIVQDVRLSQGGSWRFYSSYHRQSSEEAFEHFHNTLGVKEAEFEGWVENSLAWASRFKDFKFTSEVSMPTKFYEPNYCGHAWHQNPKIPQRDHSLMYTMELIKKHGRMDWKNPTYVQRLQAEIKLLHNNGTIDLLPYFFIDEECCSIYEAAGLLTGPGRGSAAGLLLTYLIGITHVDPIKYELSMDRFLTIDRISSGKLPDIDQDLPHRDLLVGEDGWFQRRFGDHCAQLSVDTKLKLKSAVKDVARMLHNTDSAADQQAWMDIESWSRKFIMPPQGLNDYDFVIGYDSDEGVYVKGSSESGHSGHDIALGEYIRKYPADWEIVQKCLGLARQKSRHACAFVIAGRPIHEFIPLTTVSDVRVTSYTAASVEAVGGLKMDFLVVNSLNDLGDAIKLIQSRSGMETPKELVVAGRRVPGHRLVPRAGELVDIWDLPEDPAVFANIATGKTETVFQFNTPGAIQWLRHFGQQREDGSYAIDSIQAMAAFTALDRPGPLDILVLDPDGDGRSKHNMLVEYARRARGATGSPDVLPIFDQLIPETYGVMVYQEQLQKIYQNLTGCTGAEAEEFRTNVAKKKKEKIDAAYPGFIEHAGAKIGVENAKSAWEFFRTWAQYGFNKSHAVCYSVIGYACAYLKHHYPLEWWTSVLKNAAKNEVNEKFWRFCGHLIDLPDVVKSGDAFEIQGERIRAPLSLLHGVGEAAHAQLIAHRPYADIVDFVRKQEQHRYDTGTMVTKTKKVKKKVPNPAYDAATMDKKLKTVVEETEVEETKMKLGYSSLNRKIISTLILSGAMDSLFPATDENGHPVLVSDQLQMYENALAMVKTEMGPVMTTGKYKGQKKPIKVEAVDPKYLSIRAISRYQMRKAILPAYGADLTKLLVDVGYPGLRTKSYTDEGETYQVTTFEWSPPFSHRPIELRMVDSYGLEHYSQETYLEPGTKLHVGVVAYVLEAKTFSYGDGKSKQALKVQLDIEGARFEFVKWPDKEGRLPAAFKQPLKGCVVIVCLTKFKSDRPFSIDDIVVVERELDHESEPEAEPADPTSDEGDESESTES